MKLADAPPNALPQPRESFTAVLLAGGQSRRMGRDKALLEINGQPLWQRQWETLRALEPDELWLSGRSYGGIEAIPDAWPNCGPLGALATVLNRATTKWVVVLAVDLPLVTTAFLRGLLEEAIALGCGVVPADAERVHPLAAVYPRLAAEIAVRRVEIGELAMQEFVAELDEAAVVARRGLAEPIASLLVNVNTPTELDEFRVPQPILTRDNNDRS